MERPRLAPQVEPVARKEAERPPEAGAAEGPRHTDRRGGRRLGLVDAAEAARGAPSVEGGEAVYAVPAARLIVAHHPFNTRSEKMRALRTELLLRHDSTELANAFAVLSPRPREGRSQLAAELAMSFAQLGRRTLLVDADLRTPGLHALFSTSNSIGLAQALATDEAPPLYPVKGQRQMYLLPAGRIPPNPLELLSDGRFECLVERWRSEFQFIVFDTPPLSDCADALAVATVVGRVLAVSRADHTPLRDMREMLQRLAATQAQVLGAVISRF